MLSSNTITVQAPRDEDEPRAALRPALFHGLASACQRLVARVGEQAGKLQAVDPRRWLVLFSSRLPWPPTQAHANAARGQITLEFGRDREAARAATDDWRSILSTIREQAAEANRLKHEFRADLAEVERIGVQLKEAHSLAIDPNSRAALEKLQELESLRAECSRIGEDARDLHSRLEAQATEAQKRCDRLTEECDSARAERDRWEAKHGALERELEQTRDLLGAEHDALAREADQLQALLEELERSQEDAAGRHERERASWERRYMELKDESERRRSALLEAESRLSQHQARFDAERDRLVAALEAAREEIALLDRQRAPNPRDVVEESAAPSQAASMVDTSHFPGSHGP
jgi:chromosome segregation ATPase